MPGSRCTWMRACCSGWKWPIRVGALTEENLGGLLHGARGREPFRVYRPGGSSADSPVSLLELETQAEVDKYAVTVFLVAEQQGGSLSCAGACAAVRPRAASTRAWSPISMSATARRTAAPRAIAGGWSAAS